MKLFLLLTSILFLTVSLLATPIDAQIEAIQKAPVEKRFKLMNAFKKKIVRMQEQERIKALTKLKSMTKNKMTQKALTKLNSHATKKSSNTQTVKHSYIDDHIDQANTIEENIDIMIEGEIEDETEDDHDDD